MRSKEEIMKDIPSPTRHDKLFFEVLFDIRELLSKDAKSTQAVIGCHTKMALGTLCGQIVSGKMLLCKDCEKFREDTKGETKKLRLIFNEHDFETDETKAYEKGYNNGLKKNAENFNEKKDVKADVNDNKWEICPKCARKTLKNGKCNGIDCDYLEDTQAEQKIEAHSKVSIDAYDVGFSNGQDDILNTLKSVEDTKCKCKHYNGSHNLDGVCLISECECRKFLQDRQHAPKEEKQ